MMCVGVFLAVDQCWKWIDMYSARRFSSCFFMAKDMHKMWL